MASPNENTMVADTAMFAIVLPASLPDEAMLLDVAVEGPNGQAPRLRKRAPPAMDWDSLPESLQLSLAGAALRHAAARIATQADTLASEMEAGGLQDRGGPDALRLLAAIVRVTGEAGMGGKLPG
jgi:hypothetical protein